MPLPWLCGRVFDALEIVPRVLELRVLEYSEVGISLPGFDVKAGEYPKDVAEFDGVLITGSLSGVYDGDAWIHRLLNVRHPLRYSFLLGYSALQRILVSLDGVVMKKVLSR